MKRWRRLVSSLLLVCLLLGSGGSLVADAVGVGQIPKFGDGWLLRNLTVGDGGNYIYSTKESAFAILPLSVQPGERYKLSGTLILSGGNTAKSLKAYIMYSSDSADNVTLPIFDVTKAGTYNLEKEFLLPDDVGVCSFYIEFGKSYNTVDYNADWSFEATSTNTGILNSIKEGFAKLWEWLQGIWDSIKEISTKIAASLTSLGDRIRDFFSSLGDRISGFFDDIWEKIKAFFLPSEGYFDEYTARFNVFIDNKFGFLAQIPDELSHIINTLVNYTPDDPPYIEFPTIKVPVPGHEFTLVQGQRYTFTMLRQPPYNIIYAIYQSFVWLAYCLMLLNLIRHKYAVVFGGDGSAG